jgi:hypothetical protein
MWKVRFSPNKAGTWQYRLTAQDASGSTQSQNASFQVADSLSGGFVRVSQTDPKYFEFDNGSLFTGLGFQNGIPLDDPVLGNQANFQKLKEYGINFIRTWQSGLYGSAWLEWLGGRNIYDGYLPRAGLLPVLDDSDLGNPHFVMVQRLDYTTDGSGNQNGWFDACRFQRWDDPEGVKRNTTYRVRVQYRASNIQGPRTTNITSNFGLVAKFGGYDSDCFNPSDPVNDPAFSISTPVTNYGGDASDWTYIQGTWNSGSNDWLPRMHIALENVLASNPKPTADIRSIEVQEVLGNGQYGPNIIAEHSMEYQLYIPQHYSHAMDKLVELAHQNDIYMKVVIMEINDNIYTKMDDDGTFVGENPQGVSASETDNLDSIYGLGRSVNKTRWLQQAWWRYAQARWGYSPNIHSWEAMNEGDPFKTSHYQLTDEMGKYFHCQVFGVSVAGGDSQKCNYDHPNDHLVSTSFWHSFPGYSRNTGGGFWGSPNYPNVDYADLHAYNSTGNAPCQEKYAMQFDAAYYHNWYSQQLASWRLGLPMVRGEAGLDGFVENPNGNCTITALDGTIRTGSFSQSQNNLGISQDTGGVWVHNYTWAHADYGAMYDLYWWVDQHMQPSGNDNRIQFKPFYNFIKTIPLNKGNYWAIGAVVDNSNLRVLGQKDGYAVDTQAFGTSHNAYFWVQNKNHTWRNVLCASGILPASYQAQYECGRPGTQLSNESGTITITGFESDKTYDLETWDTWDTQSADGSYTTSTIKANSKGDIVLTVNNLNKDVAYKILDSSQQPDITPPPKLGDANGDNKVDGVDYVVWLNNYNTQTINGHTDGDFNIDKGVDGIDYVVWLNNYGT